jgi:DNA-binding ferritin-like protein
MVKMDAATQVPIEIGIEAKDRKAVAEGLAKLLADSYTQRLQVHEKNAWMLRSLLE